MFCFIKKLKFKNIKIVLNSFKLQTMILVKVIANAKQNKLVALPLNPLGPIKISVKAKPIQGQANKAVIDLFSKVNPSFNRFFLFQLLQLSLLAE